MHKINIWYTIEKSNDGYTVWLNKESYEKDKNGSYGSLGIYTAKRKKDCVKYCKERGIKVE